MTAQTVGGRLLALLVMTLATAGPVPVLAVVVPDPAGGVAAERHALGITALLEGSGTYRVLPVRGFEERVGAPAGLYTRCLGTAACWRDAGSRAGVEQVVLVEVVDDEMLGVRVLDVDDHATFRMGAAPVDSDAQWRLVDSLFFSPGSVRLVDAPEHASVIVDGRPAVAFDGSLRVEPLGAGKHTFEVSAPGHLPSFYTVLVRPKDERELVADLLPIERRNAARRWTTWFGVGLVVVGTAAIAGSAGAIAHATRP